MDKPGPVAFQDGWNIKPDMIVEMPRGIFGRLIDHSGA
jgi:hypothetical protein